MRTYGNGDPRIPPAVQAAHDAASAAQKGIYLDPRNGRAVMTAWQLEQQPGCCANGCRHCPYSRADQAKAGRRVLRPE